MNLETWNGLLALMPPSGGQQSQAPWWASMVPLLLMFVAFYFLLIRPQQRKAKEHDLLIKSVKTGDKILTSGGILGTVVGVKEKSISIRSAESKLEVLKSAVSEITERASGNGGGEN